MHTIDKSIDTLVQSLPQSIRVGIFFSWTDAVEQNSRFSCGCIEIKLRSFSVCKAIDRTVCQGHVWVCSDITAVTPRQSITGITVVRVPPIISPVCQ